MNRPRLLVISPRFLFPMNEGGKIRTANILKRMKGGAFAIDFVSPGPANHADYRHDLESISDRFVLWPQPERSQIRRLSALLDPAPVAAATDRSQAGARIVAQALDERPDAVLVDFPHAAVLLPDTIAPPSVIFTHNVEAEIFERHAAVAKGPMRLVWRDQSRKMRRFEGDALRRFDSVIAVSKRDAGALKALYGLPAVETIDTGVDLEFYPFAPAELAPAFGAGGGTIVFTGAMDWRANIDGVAFLMDEVWPLIAAARPEADMVVVGRNPPEALIAEARARNLPWRFTGFVDDIRPYVSASHVYVIPLRVGSGTRIKAFEAMAMGRPVVSTTVGVEGLDVTPGEHFLAADSAADFAAAILRLLANADLRGALARAARARVEARFSWSHVARQFESICMRALARRCESGTGAETLTYAGPGDFMTPEASSA
jgi:glycosyltransferase involved in cell wall biosynthesis